MNVLLNYVFSNELQNWEGDTAGVIFPEPGACDLQLQNVWSNQPVSKHELRIEVISAFGFLLDDPHDLRGLDPIVEDVGVFGAKLLLGDSVINMPNGLLSRFDLGKYILIIGPGELLNVADLLLWKVPARGSENSLDGRQPHKL